MVTLFLVVVIGAVDSWISRSAGRERLVPQRLPPIRVMLIHRGPDGDPAPDTDNPPAAVETSAPVHSHSTRISSRATLHPSSSRRTASTRSRNRGSTAISSSTFWTEWMTVE